MFGLIALASNFSSPLTRLTISVQQLQSVQGSLRRLATVLATRPEQPTGSRRTAPPLTGHIELRDVGLRHPGAAGWAVRHITLTIPAGTQLAFVGPSGSGKSTLVKLILGLYPPSEGRILFDGHDLAELDYQTVRRQCGVVTQEVAVFNGTIRQNIAFGTPDLPLADVRRAAQLADLERDVAAMPMGYETIISENGSALSGGQRQRLELARALVHQPACSCSTRPPVPWTRTPSTHRPQPHRRGHHLSRGGPPAVHHPRRRPHRRPRQGRRRRSR